MTVRRILSLASVLALAAGASASAEVVLEGVHWQIGRVEGGRVVSWQDSKVLKDAPPKLDNRVRARLVIRNQGDKPEETLLIRYSMTARVSPDGAPADGSWSIPFIVDERRVAKIAPNQTIELPLNTGAALDLYVRRLARAGWWLDRLKLQVMMEPHPGSLVLRTVEDIIEVRRGEKP